MSAPQEFTFTAHPEVPFCLGSNCYCFFGRNQMDAPIEESDASDFPPPDPWQILDKEPEWAVSLFSLRFRHPRVLLAYFRFVWMHNEIAKEGEHIEVPEIPHDVCDFILSHTSIQDPPAEFKNEVDELKSHVEGWRSR